MHFELFKEQYWSFPTKNQELGKFLSGSQHQWNQFRVNQLQQWDDISNHVINIVIIIYWKKKCFWWLEK